MKVTKQSHLQISKCQVRSKWKKNKQIYIGYSQVPWQSMPFENFSVVDHTEITTAIMVDDCAVSLASDIAIETNNRNLTFRKWWQYEFGCGHRHRMVPYEHERSRAKWISRWQSARSHFKYNGEQCGSADVDTIGNICVVWHVTEDVKVEHMPDYRCPI